MFKPMDTSRIFALIHEAVQLSEAGNLRSKIVQNDLKFENLSEEEKNLVFTTPHLLEWMFQDKRIKFQEIPDNLKTPEICLAAIKRTDVMIFPDIPDNLKTPEICLIAVKQYGPELSHVPEHLKTPEVCLEAVRQYGIALTFVPEHFKTPELCLEAVKSSGRALRYVPKHLKTPELCFEAVKDNELAFQFVPEHLKQQIKEKLK